MAQKNLNKQFGVVRVVDNTTLNDASGVEVRLSALDSGTHYNINGTGNNKIFLPNPSTDNVGVNYSFLLTTAVGAGTTTTFKLKTGDTVADTSNGDFHAAITLTGDPSACTETLDDAGNTITLPNAAVVGTRVNLLCIADPGTTGGSAAQIWKAEIYGSGSATVANT